MYFCRLFAVFTSLLLCFYSAEGQDLKKPECATFCTAIYQPICATNGLTMRTFSNACSMSVENCTKGAKWRKVGEGMCSRGANY